MDRAKPLPNTVPGDAYDVAVGALTRDQARSRRAREVRKSTMGLRHITKAALRAGALSLRDFGCTAEDYKALDEQRPRTRGDCVDAPRPCPYVACRHHLYLDATDAGGITLNFPDLEPEDLVESCSLDVAESGVQKLEEVGALMNITRERVRQIQEKAEERLKKRRQLADWEGHESRPRGDRE